MPIPKTTIICAVWHKDSDRVQLIKEHAENLMQQTVPVEVIYILDNDDEIVKPELGTTISITKAIPIYEAWNLGIAATQTPYVMNLNLDDRLNKDTVEIFQNQLEEHSAALVGGDWKICYSQEDTNKVENCFPASQMPFLYAWPPQKNSNTRLGSGTGERGTYGPATLWRMECHLLIPRYPYRTICGEKITSIADAVWWSLLANHSKQKLIRIPFIVGNYFSHPETQAEFRNHIEHETLAGKNISLI